MVESWVRCTHIQHNRPLQNTRYPHLIYRHSSENSVLAGRMDHTGNQFESRWGCCAMPVRIDRTAETITHQIPKIASSRHRLSV